MFIDLLSRKGGASLSLRMNNTAVTDVTKNKLKLIKETFLRIIYYNKNKSNTKSMYINKNGLLKLLAVKMIIV